MVLLNIVLFVEEKLSGYRIFKEKNMSEISNDLKCMTFSKNDISRIENESYNQALEDMANKLKSKPYWDDEHNFQAIPIDYIDEVLERLRK